MNIVLDILIKGILGGLGKAFADGLSKLLGLFMTEKMIATVLIGLAEALVKRTKNTIDDNAVAVWKEQIKASGIEI